MDNNNDNMFDVLDDDLEEVNETSSIEVFKENFENLDSDIIHIDGKMQSIQSHITALESKILMIDNYIQNNQKNAVVDLGKSFAAYNKTYELLSFMQKSYQIYMDLKFKYRTETSGLKYKLYRMDEIDKKKMIESDELNSSDVISAISNLMKSSDKQENATKEMINNPKYNI
jgi:prophage DNA circulation protein